MNARQLAAILDDAQHASPEAKSVEYSQENRDMTKLRTLLRQNDNFDDVLGDHNTFSLLSFWQKRLPGFWW